MNLLSCWCQAFPNGTCGKACISTIMDFPRLTSYHVRREIQCFFAQAMLCRNRGKHFTAIGDHNAGDAQLSRGTTLLLSASGRAKADLDLSHRWAYAMDYMWAKFYLEDYGGAGASINTVWLVRCSPIRAFRRGCLLAITDRNSNIPCALAVTCIGFVWLIGIGLWPRENLPGLAFSGTCI